MTLDLHVHRHLTVFNSELCFDCMACICGTDEDSRIPSQIIPVTPQIYADYFCSDCFVDLPVGELVKRTKAYIMTEKEFREDSQRRWTHGSVSSSPFRYLEHSIKYLRGQWDTPPFPSATFSLHSTFIKGYPPIRYHGPLALISFD